MIYFSFIVNIVHFSRCLKFNKTDVTYYAYLIIVCLFHLIITVILTVTIIVIVKATVRT